MHGSHQKLMHGSHQKLKQISQEVYEETDSIKMYKETVEAREDLNILEFQRLSMNIWVPDLLKQITESDVQNIEGIPVINIVEKMRSIEIVLLKAGTGSGKSLEIAQAIEAEEFNNGKKIILTQPRILNTINIAKRISQEVYNNTGNISGITYRTSTSTNIAS